MSKTSKPSYPAYSNGEVKINGETKSNLSRSNNTITSNYNMNDYEKSLYDYSQKTLSEILPDLNNFSPDTIKNLNSQVNAYTKQGQKTIENLYTPMLTNLKNDIASRFGNFDNSMFMDNLKQIENNRADSMSTLAENILSKQNSLYNDELSRRYQFANLLYSLQNGSTNNALSYIASALQNSNSGNNYNNSSYNAALANSNYNGFNEGINNLQSIAKLALNFL